MEKQHEDIYGHVHMLTKQLGTPGGQGVVYRTADPDLAVKLLHNSTRIENSRYMELRLLPLPARINLTLPCAELKNAAGYVMPLLDDMEDFEKTFTPGDAGDHQPNAWLDQMSVSAPEFAKFMSEYLKTGGVRKRLVAYLGAARVLAALHTRGLVYCDFSGRNCFLSTAPGSDVVWLIDADNLSFAENISREVVHTPEFAAPEVIHGGQFSPWSDCYSFAISLFRDLMGVHPFKGRALEECDFEDDKDDRAYEGNLPWVCDQADDSNSSDDGLLSPRDMILTGRLFRLFDRTFSQDGRTKCKTRPTMIEWAFALAEALDASVKCSCCGMHFDISHTICPWCDTAPHVVSLESRKNGALLWKFVREATPETPLRVSNRLIEGFKLSSPGDNALSIRCGMDNIHVFDMNPGYTWAVSVDGGKSFQDIYGHADIPGVCLIRCSGAEADHDVMIEVNLT